MSAIANQPVVMVVDDVPANVRLLGEILRSRGYAVRECSGGAEALAAAAESPPDLILLDISMPGLDGYTVCERLKADDRLVAVPVLFLSSLSETMDKVKGFKAGGVDYITKPFDIDEILARVETHLKIHQLQEELTCRHRELAENYRRLKELEALRDSLVHMIVHDLRNPVAAIASFQFILETEGEALSERARSCVRGSLRSAAYLTEMINTVLDVGKLESGRMQLHLEDCDLAALGRAVIDHLDPIKGERKILLEAPEEPALVRGDRQLLSRLIQNLAGNALKFTSGSEGTVVIGVESRADAVRVTVQDNGPGIPPEHLGKVFEKYWQGEARSLGFSASTGLGLTFCRMVAEAHGGTIGVESELGKGSTFWFELPVGGTV